MSSSTMWQQSVGTWQRQSINTLQSAEAVFVQTKPVFTRLRSRRCTNNKKNNDKGARTGHEITYYPGPPAQNGTNVFRHYLTGVTDKNDPVWEHYRKTMQVTEEGVPFRVDEHGNSHYYYPGPPHHNGRIRGELSRPRVGGTSDLLFCLEPQPPARNRGVYSTLYKQSTARWR